ncbi:glycoside hydrolase family 38 N-terminal domain-containing protein [Paenibacillus tianjinensis]|uniref:Glycoside hydrolase family 38 central domain-containing protein n=1 Tax=Paenibacillus tianjinensis TaxID=2810347 RepID=A0ABX7LE58_9BACL|nr:alpha-mannosidase [Paenibacillus tianjinensis]QSF46407.1 hypothetical protein JRJ22_07445 [Paenibacillus tianjinensis]
MKTLYLLSNAHLDPVWQWEWEEGAAAAVSTFRAAAGFCEDYDGYIFNHNEAILYQWVEEYEPVLFARIQRLVRQGRWHIMGGWYLQPDCNMPSGESFARQILAGRSYFRDKFGVRPTTAINFDSFGHSRGLVQIMQLAGYDSYIFMRPDEHAGLPGQDFIWEGFAGSSVMAHKIAGGYHSALGRADQKIADWLATHADEPIGLLLWGVGNHGGGPSRLDLDAIAARIEQSGDFRLVHATPEQYFAALPEAKELPRYSGDLNPRFVGCYTSMIRIKQKHRQLENELYATEKMLAAAGLYGLLPYPARDLAEAQHDLLTAQFHDILPGTSIQPAEEASLRQLDHGVEITARLKARAFFALAAGQPQAQPKEYPILIYNPHPYPVSGIFECEFMLEDQNWLEQYSNPAVYQGSKRIPSQAEKEHSNLNLDWRKRVVFRAELAPAAMNRFDCRIELLERKPAPALQVREGAFYFRTGELSVTVNAGTGLIDEYSAGGVSYLLPGAFAPLAVADNEDPWRMDTDEFREVIGQFSLMNEREGSLFSGVKETISPVRIIEDGEVRTVIESVLQYNDSRLVLTYKLPKQGTEIEVHARVYWNEKDRMLKLSIPTVLKDAGYLGQTAFGVQELAANGQEVASQKWTALQSAKDGHMLTVINDGIYGSDCCAGEIRLSLLRGAGYCAHPIGDRPIMPQDRFLPRIDQGERCFTFWMNAGALEERAGKVDREALMHAERPFALSFFPSGEGNLQEAAIMLTDGTVQMSAFKKEQDGEGYIVRLFEPTGYPRSTGLSFPPLGITENIELKGFEIVTLRIDPQNGAVTRVGICEESLTSGGMKSHG